jgi:acyl carrier protein
MANTETHLLEQKILLILRDQLAIDVPAPDTDLIASGSLDSLALVELLLRIEESVGVAIPVEELDLRDFRSVRSIGALLAKRLAPR